MAALQIPNKLDSSNMAQILVDFPEQVKKAIEIGTNSDGFRNANISDTYAILGMGGSAIGGDLLKTYAAATPGADHLTISVHRNYNIPKNINKDTNIIASSYSGGTEETLSAFEQSRKITKNILCISSDGELSQLAKQYNYPLIAIPGGMQPRCAIGYSFFTMLMALLKHSFKDEAKKEVENSIKELIPLLEERALLYSKSEDDNAAYTLAKAIHDKIPIIYSSNEKLDAVNRRWRGQFQENAKNLAFGNYLPEMNHNEINSFSFPENFAKNFTIILLKDESDHPRTKVRFDALESLLKDYVEIIIPLRSEGKYFLTRILDLIYLGDWISYHLAMLNGVDPTPIPLITKLKNFLQKQ